MQYTQPSDLDVDLDVGTRDAEYMAELRSALAVMLKFQPQLGAQPSVM